VRVWSVGFSLPRYPDLLRSGITERSPSCHVTGLSRYGDCTVTE
jgi:hypothetical protein